MSTPFVIAVPAKGRLQANAEAFFAGAGLELVKPRISASPAKTWCARKYPTRNGTSS